MAILIDGYNLMFGAGMTPRRVSRATLEQARTRLLDSIATLLDEATLAQTTIVFDVKASKRGFQRESHYRTIKVMFAVDYDEADDLLEELIRDANSPKSLVVVSSDHRIQRAAKRRRAIAVNSESWWDQLEAASNRTTETAPLPPGKPRQENDTEYWLNEFDIENMDTIETANNANAPEPEFENPFPSGYGEDLLDDE